MIKSMNLPKTYLTEAYAIDNKSILRILTQNKQINKADPAYSYYEKLANWANENGRQQKLKNIDLNTIKLSDKGLIEKHKLNTRYTTLGHVLLALKNIMDQEGKYTPSSEISGLAQQTTLDILAGLSGIKDPKKPEDSEDDSDDTDDDNTDNDDTNDDDTDNDNTDDDDTDDDFESKLISGKSRDWTAYRAEKLATTNGKPTSKVLSDFYDEYYSVEYAGVESPEKDTLGIVKKLKSLDKILIPEFNKLGYNPDVNPFAQFLKILIKEKPKIFNKLNTNNYGAIHNSFIDQKVTGNMLGNYDKGNILFCNDLYNKNGLDIVEYLDLQHQVLKQGGDSKIKDLIAKIFIQQNVNGESYSEKVKNLSDLPNPILPDADVAKLRSELEIRELYRYLFGHDAKKTENDNNMSKIVNETEDDIILDMIYYLTSQYKVIIEDNDEEEIIKWLKDFKYSKDTTKIEECKQILSKYSKMKSAKTVLSLIGKLQAKKRKGAENKK